MQDMKRLKSINQALNKKKDAHQFELSKINASIQKKLDSINKMIVYQQEYHDSLQTRISKAIPALNNNLFKFMDKITDVIHKAELDVVQLKKHQAGLLEKIIYVDNQLKFFAKLSSQVKLKQGLKEERSMQQSLDDMIARTYWRKNND